MRLRNEALRADHCSQGIRAEQPEPVGPFLFFGPGGATLIKLTGSSAATFAVGWAGLMLWATVPVLAAQLIFARQDV